MFLSSGSNYPIGLDISDLSLKVVQLNKKANRIFLQAIGGVDLPAGLIVGGEIKDTEKVIKMIRKLIDKPKFGRISSENVVACLPEPKTFIKLIEIEKTPNNLADIIEGEIEKHVPLLIDETYYDWQIIKEIKDKQQVLIGAAPKEIVNQYTDILDKAKLSVEALEIEPMSLCRSLLREEASDYKGLYDKNYAILDFGAVRTSMIIYSRNTILFTVSMPISGEKMTLDISKGLKIKKHKAEKAKIICGLDKSRAKGIVNRVLTNTINDLNLKINEAIEFYNNHFSDRGQIENILLCGGGANISGIDELISKAVAIPVKRGDSLINLGEAKDKFLKLLTKSHNLNADMTKKDNSGKKPKSAKKTSITQDTNLTYATAFGLALRNIFIDKL